MTSIPEVNHGVEATDIASIGLIKDDANLATVYSAQPSISLGMDYFEGTFLLAEYVDRPISVADIDIGSQ